MTMRVNDLIGIDRATGERIVLKFEDDEYSHQLVRIARANGMLISDTIKALSQGQQLVTAGFMWELEHEEDIDSTLHAG